MRKKIGAVGLSAILVGSSLLPYGASQIQAKEVTHQVQKGDTLWRISQKYHVTVANIKSWNNLSGNVIRIGQNLIVSGTTPQPEKEKENGNTTTMIVNVKTSLNVRKSASTSASAIGSLSNKQNVSVYSISNGWAKIDYKGKTGYVSSSYLVKVNAPNTPKQPDVEENVKTYKVKKGDTLSRIANLHSVSVSNLKKWNNLKSDVIYVGQILNISTKVKEEEKPASPSTNPQTKTHIVKSGDTLWKISQQYKTSVADILKWNNLPSSVIKVGQMLKVSNGQNAPSNPPSSTTPFNPPVAHSQVMNVEAKGIYVSGAMANHTSKLNGLLSLVQRTELNAMVIDVKLDGGEILYNSDVPLANQYKSDQYQYVKNKTSLMKTLKEKNIYSIARVVTFKDPYMAKKNTSWALKNKNGSLYSDNGQYWVNPYNKEYWEYVIDVAKEAASLGFHEIQFDYVRFPTNGAHVDKVVNYGNTGGKSKKEIIGEFLNYAKKELKPYNVKISADVFGIVNNVKDDSGIGQQWEYISPNVDVISPMMYPSHYGSGYYGISNPNANPYLTIKKGLEHAITRNNALKASGKHAAQIRPWLQDFSQHGITYGVKQVNDQIRAAKELGVNEYMLWNAKNVYTEGALK